MRQFRYLSLIIIFLTVVFLPYWIYIPLLLSAMIFFPFFWEGIIFAFLIEALYGRGVVSFAELLSPAALVAMLILIALLPVRERLRINV